MRRPPIFIISLKLTVLCSLITRSSADVLSQTQTAPPFARGSGGLVLPLPLAGKSRVPVSQPSGNNAVDGVQREEVTSFKKIGDETILVVEGSLGYNSPEGLPVSVKFKADENGNRASFKIGTGSPSSGGKGPNKSGGGGSNQGVGGGGGGGGGSSNQGGGGGGGDKTYLPPNKGGGGGGPNKGGGGGPNKGGGGGGGPNKGGGGGGGPNKGGGGGGGPNKGGGGGGGPNKGGGGNGKTQDRTYLPPS